MTPHDVFRQLLTLYPNRWDDEAQKGWGKVYISALTGVDPEALEKAFNKAVQNQEIATPPLPKEILKYVDVKKDVSYTVGDRQWPHRKKAHSMFKDDPVCKQAAVAGWGLGLWEFIAKNDRMPNNFEQDHIIRTNDLFHAQYAICGTEKTITMDTSLGRREIRVGEDLRDIYEKQMEKRARIIDIYV